MNDLSEEKTGGGRVSLRTILRARLLLGSYSAISRNRFQRFLERFYCFCLLFAIPTAALMDMSVLRSLQKFSIYILIVQRTLISFMSLMNGENPFFHFCKVIEEFDRDMGYNHLQLITPAVQHIFIVQCALAFLLNFLYFFSGHYVSLPFSWQRFSCTLAGLGIVFSVNLTILSLDLLRYRIGLLQQVLKNNFNRNNLIKCLKCYKVLMDNFDSTFPWAKLQIIMDFIAKFSVFVIQGYLIVWNYRQKDATLLNDVLLKMVPFVIGCIGACMPSVFAELVASEVHKFEILINDQITICNDAELLYVLGVAADYLELRPFQVTFCRAFALDSSLAVAFLGLCASYFIVINQITGLL